MAARADSWCHAGAGGPGGSRGRRAHAAERAHRHTRARQFFYLLEGELTAAPACCCARTTGLEIAPGEIHQAASRGALPVRFTVTSQPLSHRDRIDV